jgi:hypothetical protein
MTESERAQVWCEERKARVESRAFLCGKLQPASEEPREDLNEAWMPVICFLATYAHYRAPLLDPLDDCDEKEPQMGNFNCC